jgi:hypothetical protein
VALELLDLNATVRLLWRHQMVLPRYLTVAPLQKGVLSLVLMPPSWQTHSEKRYGNLISQITQ